MKKTLFKGKGNQVWKQGVLIIVSLVNKGLWICLYEIRINETKLFWTLHVDHSRAKTCVGSPINTGSCPAVVLVPCHIATVSE